MSHKSSFSAVLGLSTAILGLLSGCDDAIKTPSCPVPSTDTVASFMVASDLHYMSPSLMTDTSTADFHNYLFADRKMLVQSPALLHSFLDSVRSHHPRILLLTGDLTKDGEEKSHQEMADSLATLRRLGIAVYVIPGNHDVNNPESRAYGSSGATVAPNITDKDFASLYHDCGYDQAIARDTASLSYVVDLLPGVRLIAMDPVRWRDDLDTTAEIVNGRFLPQTVTWIKAQLAAAKTAGKVVVGAMHHGILEHFADEATNPVSKEYVVAGFDTLGPLFAANGMHVVFTGHFHANDIASKTYSNNMLTDIETGSLVSAPSPFRLGEIRGANISVNSSMIREISQNVGGDFQTWANRYLIAGMTQLTNYTLRTQFGQDSATAAMLSPYVASAYAAHYAGNEVMPAEVTGVIGFLNNKGTAAASYFASTLQALYTDLSPSDSAGTFSLL